MLGAYVGLTKPRIIELLLVTTVPAMFLAAGGVPPLLLVLPHDARRLPRRRQRQRLQLRPRPRHRRADAPHAPAPAPAARGGPASRRRSSAPSSAWPPPCGSGFFVNWLSAGLALGANAFYVVVYTLLLKRRTSQNIVWGGIAGCFPPLIGWTAVTGEVALAPFVLFAIVFFWTPPHTWALAFRYREDYAAAEVPMLPVVRSALAVSRQILAYSVVTVAVSLALWPVAGTGWLYPLVAAVTGAALIWEAGQLLVRARRGLTDAALKPMRLFHWSQLLPRAGLRRRRGRPAAALSRPR